MRRYRAIILLYICPILVESWSGDAHRVILDIAISNMEYETKNHLIGLTQTDDYAHLRQWLIDESTWADTEDANYPASGENPKYHFVHTSTSCGPYNPVNDCGDVDDPGVCLVTGITKHIRTMVSARSSPIQRVTALKYLIHFLADLHQPLHVGFRSDRGGNEIKGVLPYNEDLHNIWDNALVHEHKRTTGRVPFVKGKKSYSALLGRLIHGQFKTATEQSIKKVNPNNGMDVEALIISMLEETSSQLTCPLSYSLDGVSNVASGNTLGKGYIAQGSRAVANQIKRAGVRLAKLMNALVAQYEDNMAEFLRATAEQEAMKQAEEEMKRILDAEKVVERAAQRKEKKEMKKVEKEARRIAEAEAARQRRERDAIKLANEIRERQEKKAAADAVAAAARAATIKNKATPVLSKKQARAEKKKALKVSSDDNLHRALY